MSVVEQTPSSMVGEKTGIDWSGCNEVEVVPADHGHTSQIIDPPTSASQPGAYAYLRTHDNGTMTVSYASQPVGASQSHTGTQVRIAAQGPQAANVIGVTNQTELFYLMGRALGVTP